jgi:hypothetical protein
MVAHRTKNSGNEEIPDHKRERGDVAGFIARTLRYG